MLQPWLSVSHNYVCVKTLLQAVCACVGVLCMGVVCSLGSQTCWWRDFHLPKRKLLTLNRDHINFTWFFTWTIRFVSKSVTKWVADALLLYLFLRIGVGRKKKSKKTLNFSQDRQTAVSSVCSVVLMGSSSSRGRFNFFFLSKGDPGEYNGLEGRF